MAALRSLRDAIRHIARSRKERAQSLKSRRANGAAVIDPLERRILLTTYWVAPNHTGASVSQSAPGGLVDTLQYLTTFQRSSAAPAVVKMEEGTYDVTQTIHITPGDSFTIIKPDDGVKTSPVISGGYTIANWQPDPTTSGRYFAAIPKVNPADTSQRLVFRNLYVNGHREVRAQSPIPNTNFSRVMSFSRKSNTLYAYIPKREYPQLGTWFAQGNSNDGNPADNNPLELVVLQAFTMSRLRIAGVVAQGSAWKLTFSLQENDDELSKRTLAHPLKNNLPFWIENALGALQSPGEWYEDTSSPSQNVVYYWPQATDFVNQTLTAVAAVPVGDAQPSLNSGQSGLQAIDGQPLVAIGSPNSAPVSDFQMQGIIFAYHGWLGPNQFGYVGMQEGIFNREVPANPAVGSYNYITELPAVEVANSSTVILNSDWFDHLGGAGVCLWGGSSMNSITNTAFTDISGDALIVDGNMNNLTAPAGTTVAKSVSDGDSIVGNSTASTGQEYFDAAGILVGFCEDLLVFSNTISDLPGTGIATGRIHATDVGAGTDVPGGTMQDMGTWSVCSIVGNKITSATEILADCAAIYLDGSSWDDIFPLGVPANPPHPAIPPGHGTLVSGNIIEGTSFRSRYNAPTTPIDRGIYMDQYSEGVTVTLNMIRGLASAVHWSLDSHSSPGYTLIGRPGAGAKRDAVYGNF